MYIGSGAWRPLGGKLGNNNRIIERRTLVYKSCVCMDIAINVPVDSECWGRTTYSYPQVGPLLQR